MEDAQRLGLEAEMGEELGFQIFWHPTDAKKAAEQDKEYGDILRVKQARQAFGRIAAQTAKQVLIQRVRDEERDLIFNEFKDRKGELIKGVVRRFEKGNNLIVDLGRTEGILPFREQTPRETYRPGDRIVAYVKDIDREARGPQVILSRSDPRLVEKLFEAEVPEIYEGIVKIVAVRPRAGRALEDRRHQPRRGRRSGGRVRRHEGRARAGRRAGAARREDRHRAVRPRSGALRVRGDPAGRGEQGHRRRGRRAHGARRPRREAVASPSAARGRTCASPPSSRAGSSTSSARRKFKQMEEEAVAAAPADRRRHRGHRARRCTASGFRTLEELAEASEQELAAMPGSRRRRGGDAHPARAPRRRWSACARSASSAASSRTEPLTERERLLFIRGVGERTVQLLEDAGYKTVEDILREDEDKLAIKTGLGIKKARAIKQGAEHFLSSESKVIEAARREAVARAREAAQTPPAS